MRYLFVFTGNHKRWYELTVQHDKARFVNYQQKLDLMTAGFDICREMIFRVNDKSVERCIDVARN